MLISVIIPAYNAGRTINRCISSILEAEKKYKNDVEIIVINDGSTDNTFNICKEFGESIVLINNKNQGVSKTRNCGLDKAVGEYIIFVDADDSIDEYYFKYIDDIIQKYDVSLINFNYHIVRKGQLDDIEMNNEEIYCKNRTDINESITLLNKSYIWNKVFVRGVIANNKLRFNEDMSFGEDSVFLCEYLKNIDKIFISNKYVYYYNDDFDNISLSKNKYNVRLTDCYKTLIIKQNEVMEIYPTFCSTESDLKTRKIITMKVIFNIYQGDSSFKSRKKEIHDIKEVSKLNDLSCDEYFGIMWKILGIMYGKVPFIIFDVILKILTKMKNRSLKY